MAETAADLKPTKTATESERIEGMLDALNPGDKILVYRIVVDPNTGKETRPIRDVLTEFQGIEDLESWIYARAAEGHWPPGQYLLDHRRVGKHGTHCRALLSLEPPPAPVAANGAGSGAGNALDTIRAAKELLGPAAAPASADAIVTGMTKALDAGVAAGKGTAPASSGLEKIMEPLVLALVKRLDTPAPAAPTGADPFTVLQKAKELGLIGQSTPGAAPRSLVEQIRELAEVEALTSRLFGGGAAAALDEPPLVAVAKIFAPYLPQLFHTVNNIVDVVRLRAGTEPGAPARPMPAAAPPPAIPSALHVLLAQTQAAIARDDDLFFPSFAEGVAQAIPDGRSFLLSVQAGTLEEEQVLAAIQAAGLLRVDEPRTRGWLLRFVHWLRVAKPVPSEAPGSAAAGGAPRAATEVVPPVRGRCEGCGQEYHFASAQEYESDSQQCDSALASDEGLCGGHIVRLDEGMTA